MIYLDNAATTKPSLAAISTFKYISEEVWMNPSSKLYSSAAANALSDSRATIAGLLGCRSDNIIFTSGSTEAANWVLQKFVKEGDHIITSTLEHPCVYNTAINSDAYVHFVKTDSYGRIDLLSLQKLLEFCGRRSGKILVALMGANNELGTVYPVEEIAWIVHQFSNAYYFADNTQLWAHGDVALNDVDFACASAHKFGGFKGCGFLYIKDPSSLQPLMQGGHQEGGMRPGTENVAGIAAMAEAFKQSVVWRSKTIAAAEDIRRYIEHLCEDKYIVNSPPDGLPNIVSVTIPECDANNLITALAMDDIYLSAGSACQTGSNEPSRVLTEIKMSPEAARQTIRISFGSDVRKEDFDIVFGKIAQYEEFLK